MRDDITILLGTVGTGMWRSTNGGQTWARPKGTRDKMPWSEFIIFSLTRHPKDPQVIFAGTQDGLYRSDDKGASFEKVDSEMNDYDVWSVAIDPSDPDTMFAGCRPGAIFRSKNGGQDWQMMNASFAEYCDNINIPRVLTMAVDPTDSRVVWAGVEVDGVRRSLDGGDTWHTIGAAVTPGEVGTSLDEPDIHWMEVSQGSPNMVITSTVRDVFTSTDMGESWRAAGARQNFPYTFCRGMAIKPDDPNTIYVGTGDSNIGVTGAVVRTRDRCESWENTPLPVAPNSPIWKFAVNGADPDTVLCCSHWGEVFQSENAGDTWSKVEREFTEIRGIVWMPN